MAGDGPVVRALHHHFGDDMKHSCIVGVTHWEQRAQPGEELPGAPPTFFFAPTQLQKRTQDWGAEAFSSATPRPGGAFWVQRRRRSASCTDAASGGRARLPEMVEGRASGRGPLLSLWPERGIRAPPEPTRSHPLSDVIRGFGAYWIMAYADPSNPGRPWALVRWFSTGAAVILAAALVLYLRRTR